MITHEIVNVVSKFQTFIAQPFWDGHYLQNTQT